MTIIRTVKILSYLDHSFPPSLWISFPGFSVHYLIGINTSFIPLNRPGLIYPGSIFCASSHLAVLSLSVDFVSFWLFVLFLLFDCWAVCWDILVSFPCASIHSILCSSMVTIPHSLYYLCALCFFGFRLLSVVSYHRFVSIYQPLT